MEDVNTEILSVDAKRQALYANINQLLKEKANHPEDREICLKLKQDEKELDQLNKEFEDLMTIAQAEACEMVDCDCCLY